MNPRKLLHRLASGSFANIRFGDARKLAEAYGWQLQRISGSHHIFSHPEVEELLNLQESRGQAKPYQLRQLLRLMERYNLRMGDER